MVRNKGSEGSGEGMAKNPKFTLVLNFVLLLLPLTGLADQRYTRKGSSYVSVTSEDVLGPKAIKIFTRLVFSRS